MENQNILTRIKKLKEHFDNGDIPRLHLHEVNPGLAKGDRLNYLYFTLPVSINFQRNSPAMWQAALKTFEDTDTNYLFYPEKVVETPYEKVQADLIKHKLGLQRNKHTDIWVAISTTLHNEYNDDPRNIIAEGQNSVEMIKNKIQIEKKKSFPYLSGTKMANYWLYILNQFTDVKLQNLHKISIIPDTHVIQCSVKLGIVSEKATPIQVADAWEELLKGSDLMLIQMHPVLWNWSRAGFQPHV